MSIRRWIEGAALALLADAAQADACHEALARFDYPAATQLAADAPASVSSRMCAARAAYETGHFADALKYLREVEAARPQGEARTYLYNWLTVTLRKLGRETEAMQYGLAALAWARRQASRQNLATALHNLAGLAYARGDAPAALALYRESIPLNPDSSERSASFNNLGLILQAEGKPAEAERWLQEAIALNRAQGHFHHLGKHLMNLGNLYRVQGHYDEAQARLDEGAQLIDEVADLYWQAVAARYRGWLARDRGDRAAAARWLALA
ncbi:MAG: tetratricopeptide repeat protein, partial [Thiobacillus sp.]|nr:tetratricopeptide repeat protein [Thiobacillus sp.]